MRSEGVIRDDVERTNEMPIFASGSSRIAVGLRAHDEPSRVTNPVTTPERRLSDLDGSELGPQNPSDTEKRLANMEERMNAYLEQMQELADENEQMRQENERLKQELQEVARGETDERQMKGKSRVEDESNPIPENKQSVRTWDPTLEERLKRMEEAVQRVPGCNSTMKRCLINFTDSPFVHRIATMDLPRKFSPPVMKLYTGNEDPLDHVALYQQKMMTISVSMETKEALMCKTFGSTLSGPALVWFMALPTGSVSSFTELVNLFVQQFASSMKIDKESEDLYSIVQKPGESLRDFVRRFNAEKIMIPNCIASTAISAFRRGLRPESDLYKDLTKNPAGSMEEVLAKATKEIKWEEDLVSRSFSGMPRSGPSKKGRFETPAQRREDRTFPPTTMMRPRRNQEGQQNNDFRIHNYRSNPNNSDRHPVDRDRNDRSSQSRNYQHHPEDRRVKRLIVPSYELNIEPREVVAVLKGMGSEARWPRKMASPPNERNKNLWCEYHNDHGHKTEDCISLRLEINHLLKRGYLKEFLTEKGKQNAARHFQKEEDQPPQSSPPQPPPIIRTINVITGGSELCGQSLSAARRTTRAAINSVSMDQPLLTPPSDDSPIVFTSDDVTKLLQPHHDALVIAIAIANCNVKRVLIDNGSSCNILFFNALQAMAIDLESVVRQTTILTGFSGESKTTMGEITLPVYAGGVNKQVKFLVVDAISGYNAILGRPWIHDMRAVPSTYHQSLKFPTGEGVKEIKGEQRLARECYQKTMKGKSQES